jgi:hypothetical protein
MQTAQHVCSLIRIQEPLEIRFAQSLFLLCSALKAPNTKIRAADALPLVLNHNLKLTRCNKFCHLEHGNLGNVSVIVARVNVLSPRAEVDV